MEPQRCQAKARWQHHSSERWEEEIPISGRHTSLVLMVLLGNPSGPSVRPTGNAHWNGYDEGFGALFDGQRGTIVSVNAFSRGWTVVFAREVGGILWTRRLWLRPCSALVAETIRIHSLEGDGWVHMVSR